MAYEQIKIKSEAARCFLCENAPCSGACPKKLPVADIIRSLRFENPVGAAAKLKEADHAPGVRPRVWMPACGEGWIGALISPTYSQWQRLPF